MYNKRLFIFFGLVIFIFLLLTGCEMADSMFEQDELIEVESNSEAGFHWPYYLYVPNYIHEDEIYLLVRSNNTGRPDSDYSVHKDSAKSEAQIWGKNLAKELNVPLLIPAFPRPSDMYTHALSAKTLKEGSGELERLDLQLLAMVDDAEKNLKDMGYQIKDDILMYGFSAPGMFANRMALIHPEKIKAAAIGQAGGWPTAPADFWSNVDDEKSLEYPIGIAGLEDLTDSKFNREEFNQTPLFIFIGDEDTGDSDHFIEFSDDYSFFEEKKQPERWPVAENIYNEMGADAEFKLYEGVEHEMTDNMVNDVIDFLSQF